MSRRAHNFANVAQALLAAASARSMGNIALAERILRNAEGVGPYNSAKGRGHSGPSGVPEISECDADLHDITKSGLDLLNSVALARRNRRRERNLRNARHVEHGIIEAKWFMERRMATFFGKPDVRYDEYVLQFHPNSGDAAFYRNPNRYAR